MLKGLRLSRADGEPATEQLAGELWPGQSVLLIDPVALTGCASRYAAAQRKGQGRIRAGAIEIIPIAGPIGYRDEGVVFWGGTDLADVQQRLQQAAADDQVAAIVLLLDSPGGTVFGVPETADMIFGLRGAKPVVALVDPMAGSAAYWLASQAEELVVTSSGSVGSIGVWSAHVDMHRALEQRGYDVTLIRAGKYKVDDHPFGPLNDGARAAIQASVDATYDQFLDAVARGRGVAASAVRSGFGEGRMVDAEPARKQGMVDRIETPRAALARLQARQPKPPASGARAGEGITITVTPSAAGLLRRLSLSRLPSAAGATAASASPRPGHQERS